jgi:hypothetical protein
VFTEETNPQNYLKLCVSGEVDETMLDALEDYVKRQKKRLAKKARATPPGTVLILGQYPPARYWPL